MAAPAVEQVIAALVSRLEAVEPSLLPRTRFKRSLELVADEQLPAKACLRRFDVDYVGGEDLSQEGAGVMSVGLADRRVRLRFTVAYPRARQERAIEDVMASDGEWAMRELARSADWTGTPVQRATAKTSVDRSKREKLFLLLDLAVQYRDAE